MKKLHHYLLRSLLPVLLALVVGACSQAPLRSDPPPVSMMSTTLTGVGHLGRMTGIPQYFVNGYWGGNVPGGGGGGGSVCCVQLPAKIPSVPYMVTVQWRTCDVSHIKFVDGKRVNPKDRCIPSEHEATVPVHYADSELGNTAVHFLPGNKIEVWSSTRFSPNASNYPGPAYSRGPAPDYAPVVDEPSTAKTQGDK